MKLLQPRRIFSQLVLARLAFDEPIMAHDHETGIELHYRFEQRTTGTLRLTAGPLGREVLAVDCDPDDINMVATLLVDGIRCQMR